MCVCLFVSMLMCVCVYVGACVSARIQMSDSGDHQKRFAYPNCFFVYFCFQVFVIVDNTTRWKGGNNGEMMMEEMAVGKTSTADKPEETFICNTSFRPS